jgi:hypothetical protein
MVKNRLTRSLRSVHALGDQPPLLFRVRVLELLNRDLDRSLRVDRLGVTEKLTALADQNDSQGMSLLLRFLRGHALGTSRRVLTLAAVSNAWTK